MGKLTRMTLLMVALVGFLASLVAVLQFVTGSDTLDSLLGRDTEDEADTQTDDSNLPPPTVVISDPVDGKKVAVVLDPDNRARFEVQGQASWVAENRHIVLLVKPVDPPASVWWAYSDITVDTNGNWTATVWYGGDGFTPDRGVTFDLQAVVTTAGVGSTVGSPGDLPLLAQTSVLRLEIAQIN